MYNASLVVPLFLVASKLASHLQARHPLLVSLCVVMWPFNSFYYPLYYTDTLSLLSILVCWFVALGQPNKRRWLLLVICGCLSVLVRQTNIIWLVFIACYTLPRNRSFPKFLIYSIRSAPRLLLSWSSVSALFVCCCLFVVFLVVNGGIVVGDHSNHRPVPHLMQLWYLVAIASLSLIALLRHPKASVVGLVALSVVVLLCIDHFTSVFFPGFPFLCFSPQFHPPLLNRR